MPDAGSVSSLYPQPPAAQTSLGSNPLALIPLIGQLNQNAQFQKEFAAKQAIGGAYRNALQPDGTLDQGALAKGLQNPDAAYGLPEAMTHVIAQRGGDISNVTAQFEQKAKQNQFLM